ncbi:MAG: hypothetical protein GF375_01340, partial [Candidatus Omnitrophica bacterium]|nr:hypothetical protein [Candidatus Omnitrophota bacterium]MBD3268773.1 hypothetical protein [Candidatus Omnitrophota bacterium]
MKCPICNETEMEKVPYEGVEIDVCSSCGGVWLDKDELGKIIKAEVETFAPEQIKKALKIALENKEERSVLMSRLMDFKKDANPASLNTDQLLDVFKDAWGKHRSVSCPRCGEEMKEFEYAGTGVMLDRCPKGHGFWLDKGELEKSQIVMEFYKKGSKSMEVSEDSKPTDRICPTCGENLREKEYEGVMIDVCARCGGVWLDDEELPQIIEKREVQFSPEERKEIDPEELKQASLGETVPELNCPVCGALMGRNIYASVSGIMIDRCSNGHGIWLDKGELEKIQIYAEKSEDLAEKNYAKYSRILNQAKLDYEARRKESLKGIEVSRFE